MMNVRLYCAAVVLGLLGTNAAAELLVHNDTSSSMCSLRLVGKITATDAIALTGLSPDCATATILFSVADSPGGDARAAMAIGRWLREHDATVMISKNGLCYSSCALVYIGGVTRYNFGDIGLHRPYLGGKPRSGDEVRTAVASMLAEVRDYVEEMGVTPEFTSIMLNTPPAGIRIFRHNAIESLVPQIDPLYDELTTARRAKEYGLSTEEYRRRDAEADEQCIGRTPDTSLAAGAQRQICIDATRWGLSVSVFQQRQSSAYRRCTQANAVSADEWAAWEAEGHKWTEHPLAVEAQDCIIAVMQGR